MYNIEEETVGYDEETVAFNAAVKHIKNKYRIFYKEITEQIGLDVKQGEQIRAGKRRAHDTEIRALIKFYPETAQFFTKFEKQYTIRHDDSADSQKLNEPMGTHFYAKQQNQLQPLMELAETQKKLIRKLEDELEDVKERLKIVEAERKTLLEIVSAKK